MADPTPQRPVAPPLAARFARVNAVTYGLTMVYAAAAILALHRDGDDRGFQRICRSWAADLLRLAAVDLRVRGAGGIDWGRPTVVMANHASLYDIPALFLAIPCDVQFPAKKELAHVPGMGWAMRAAGFPFIDRGSPERSRATVDRMVSAVQPYRAIAFFPEGTRSADGRLQPLKRGGFLLALRAGAQVVPTWIDGAFACLPKDRWVPEPGQIEVRFGAPIATAPGPEGPGYGLDDRAALTERVLEALHALERGEGIA